MHGATDLSGGRQRRALGPSRRWALVSGLAVVGLGLIVGIVYAAVDRKSDEQKVNELLVKVAAAVDAESTKRIMRLLDTDYSDDLGNSRLSLRRHLAEAFLGSRSYRVFWGTPAVRASGEDGVEAEVAVRVEELSSGSFVRAYDGPLRIKFKRHGRQLRAQRVDGLLDIAKSVADWEGYLGY